VTFHIFDNVFAMAMLKYVKVEPRKNCNPSILSKGDIEAGQKSIASAASEKSKTDRGQYNSYSKE